MKNRRLDLFYDSLQFINAFQFFLLIQKCREIPQKNLLHKSANKLKASFIRYRKIEKFLSQFSFYSFHIPPFDSKILRGDPLFLLFYGILFLFPTLTHIFHYFLSLGDHRKASFSCLLNF